MRTQPGRFQPHALALLRIVAGFLLCQQGLSKLFGWFGGEKLAPFSPFWFAGLLESGFGVFLLAGWNTRLVALLLALEMMVATVWGYLPRVAWPSPGGGSVSLLFAAIFLHLATVGAGSWALRSPVLARAFFEDLLSRLDSFTLMLLRVASGCVFTLFGYYKVAGFIGEGNPAFLEMRWFASFMEILGGPLLVLGVWTRPLAFLLSGEMAVAYWTSHFPRGRGIWPIENGGELAVLFCFIYLYLVSSGPGWFSCADLFRRARNRRP